MQKIGKNFILDSYRDALWSYKAAVREVGLWASEQYVIGRYFNRSAAILDIGCGAGRTTLALMELGYDRVTGIDINPDMIAAALIIADEKKLPKTLQVGDATALKFPDQTFDSVLFSFNGIMTIPRSGERQKAFDEISRVLKPGGAFVFTTHDRDKNVAYLRYWKEEAARWEKGQQNPRLHEFGDVVGYSEDVMGDIYIHIPAADDIRTHLEAGNFELVETFYRSDQFAENEAVRGFSGECRFWVAKKKPQPGALANNKS